MSVCLCAIADVYTRVYVCSCVTVYVRVIACDCRCVELARTIWLAKTILIRCIYSISGRGITKNTVIYGVYIRFWPTLDVYIRVVCAPCVSAMCRPGLFICFLETKVCCNM